MAFDPRAYAEANLAPKGAKGGFDPKTHAAKMVDERRADALLNPKPYWTGDDNQPGGEETDVHPAPHHEDDADTAGTSSPHGNPNMFRNSLRGKDPEEARSLRAQGAGMLAGTAATGGLGALFGAAAGPAAGFGARLLSSVLASAGGGEVEAATRAKLEGKKAADVLDAAGRGGETGAKWGLGGHLVGEAAAGGAGMLRKGKGLVARYLRAKDAGAYEDPAMLALPGKEEGVQQAAEVGHGRVVAKDAALEQQAGQDYQAALNPPGPRPAPKSPVSREAAILDSMPDRPEQNALLAAARNVDAPPLAPPTAREKLLSAARNVDAPGAEPHTPGGYKPKPDMVPQEPWPAEGLQRPVDRKKLIASLEEARAKNIDPDTGKPIIPAVEARYLQALEAMGPEGTTNTVGGTLARRRGLRDEAGFGSPSPTPDQGAARKVYGAYRQGVREAAPDVAVADDAYASHARQASRRRDILTRSESPISSGPRPGEQAPDAEFADGPQGAAADLASAPEMRVAKEQAGTRMLKREGDTNEPGLNAQKYLDELRAQDPEFAAALDFIGNKKALEGTRFGAPHLPTNLGDAAGHLGPMPIRYLHQNARALARPLDAALGAGANLRLAAPFSGAVGNPLFDANEEDKKRRKKGH